MNKQVRQYLAEIGAKGGSVTSEAKTTAARQNAKRPRPKRTIVDEFSDVPDRRKRYHLRQARKKMLEREEKT